jgi:hypothetical protein
VQDRRPGPDRVIARGSAKLVVSEASDIPGIAGAIIAALPDVPDRFRQISI